jgi:hypothetical protein
LNTRIGNAGGFETIESFEQDVGVLGPHAMLDRLAKQAPRGRGIAAMEGRRTRVQQFLAFALALGNRAARTLDIRAGTRVPAIDEERSRPHIDGEFVLTSEVVIQTAQQQFLETRLTIVLGLESCGYGRVLVWYHGLAFHAQSNAIMSRTVYGNKPVHAVPPPAVDRASRR